MRGVDQQSVDSELWALAREIEAAQSTLAARQAELSEIEADLAVFRQEVEARMGVQLAELERAEHDLAACKRRIEVYRQWGSAGIPRTAGGNAYVSVEEQYRRTWQEPEEPAPRARSWSEIAKRVHPADSPIERRIRIVYRELCRRYHPDLVQDEAEKARRTEITAAINAAYATRLVDARQSLAELEALAEASLYAHWEASGTAEQRAAALRSKLRRLREQVAGVERAIRALTDSPDLHLSLEVKLARRRGSDLLADLQAEVERDLARRKIELEFVQAQLRELGLDG